MANELPINNPKVQSQTDSVAYNDDVAYIDTIDDLDDGGEFIEVAAGRGEKALVASQWQLMWWRFLKHKIALVSAVIVILFYLLGAFAEFMAVNDPLRQHADTAFLPPPTHTI